MISLLLTVYQYGRHNAKWKPAIDKLSAFADSHKFNSFSILSYNEQTFSIFTSCLRWQQDSKLRFYDIQFKLLGFKYIASQQITITYLTFLNLYSYSVKEFAVWRRNHPSSYLTAWSCRWDLGSKNHLEQQRHDSLYFFLSVVRGMNLNVLKCCQVVRYGPFDVWWGGGLLPPCS